jgi:hypothetical protein
MDLFAAVPFEKPALPPFREYQTKAVRDAIDGVVQGVPANLMSSPTGSGKTIMQVAILSDLPGGLQVIPSLDIGLGFARWMGLPSYLKNGTADRGELEVRGVFTARRLANLLSAGAIDPTQYRYVQMDEAHHSVDNTHLLIDQYMGGKPRLGWTGTAYRGTPQETGKLWKWWNNKITTVLSEAEAKRLGFVSIPTTEVWPLVNDETIDLRNGEFVVSKIESRTLDKLDDLIEEAIKNFWDESTGLWRRPIIFTFTTTHLVHEAVKRLNHRGATADALVAAGYDETNRPTDAESTREPRSALYQRAVACETALVQIKIVGEGVDLPLRIMIDAAPTMSPPFWRQRIGRIMRPVHSFEAPPQYVCTNHNLLRHGYLMEGLLPPASFRQARQAWGPDFKPSRRMVARASGLDGLGRFVPNEVPMADGSFWWMFAVGEAKPGPGGTAAHYAALVDPAGGQPNIWAKRVFEFDDDGVRKWDANPPWKRLSEPPTLEGCLSVPPNPLTPPMARWWKNAARFRGLDNEAEVNSRVFAALPLMTDLGLKYRTGRGIV